MALIPCDKCGGHTGQHGSWSAPIKILCGKCSNSQPIIMDHMSRVTDNVHEFNKIKEFGESMTKLRKDLSVKVLIPSYENK